MFGQASLPTGSRAARPRPLARSVLGSLPGRRGRLACAALFCEAVSAAPSQRAPMTAPPQATNEQAEQKEPKPAPIIAPEMAGLAMLASVKHMEEAAK